MKPSLREVLEESHIAAIAVAMLLAQSGGWLFQLLWFPISAIIDNIAPRFTASDFFHNSALFSQFTIIFLFQAICRFVAAWILSQLVYGVGPFRALNAKLARIRSQNA